MLLAQISRCSRTRTRCVITLCRQPTCGLPDVRCAAPPQYRASRLSPATQLDRFSELFVPTATCNPPCLCCAAHHRLAYHRSPEPCKHAEGLSALLRPDAEARAVETCFINAIIAATNCTSLTAVDCFCAPRKNA